MPDTPVLDRLALENTFDNYQAGPINTPDLPNIAHQGISTPMPITDMGGDRIVSPLDSLENSVVNSATGDGKLKGGSISRSLEESTSNRFNQFIPGYNNEDAYAQGQGWASKMVNGVGKGLALTGTTFLQSTIGMVNGIAQAIVDGRAASFYDNEFNRNLDELNKKLEDSLPNYYTDAEKNANWYSPTKLFTANFFWDGIVKNLGFAAGAALSGSVFTQVLRALPLAARLFSSGKAAEALAATEEALVSTEKAAQTFGRIKSLSDKFLGSYTALNTGGRVLVAGLATTGEAGFEAYNNLNDFRNTKIQEYKDKNGGIAPIGAELDAINAQAENVGNASFLLNTALLSATNYIQFPKILGSSYKAEKGMINSLTRDINEIAKNAAGDYIAAPSRFGKLLSTVNKVRPYIFNVAEGFEEGAQYAIQVGTKDYYDKKYRGTPNDIIESIGEGISQTIGTNEGMENILIGGLSGSIMTGRERFRESVNKSKNTTDAVGAFNKTKLSDFTKATVDAVNRGVAIQEDRETALRQGDILESKDKEADYIINYLTPRIKYGRFDLVMTDIQEAKELATTDQGFAQLQSEGKALPGDTKESYMQRILNLETTAANVKSLYQSLNIRYGGMVDKDGKALYASDVMDKMVYAATKVSDYDKRIDEISQPLMSAQLDTIGVVNTFLKGDTSLFDKAMISIDALSITADQKEDLRQNLQDVVELSMRREKFLTEYEDIKKSPKQYAEPEEIAPLVGTTEKTTPKTVKVTTKDGEEELEVGTEYYLGDYIKKDAKGRDVYLFPKLTIMGENPDGTIQVKDKNGLRNISKDELSKYKLGKVSDTINNKKAKFFLENINNTFEFNFGKGKKKVGRLRYSPKDRILEFVYKEGNKTKTIEVTGDQFKAKEGFKQAMITKVGTLTAAEQQSIDELAKEKDDRVLAKREARIKIIESLVDETGSRLEKVQKDLAARQEQLSKTVEELDKLNKKIEAGDMTKRGNFKATTRNAIRAANRLSNLKDSLETEIDALTTEKDELEFNLEYFYDMAQNIDELPTDSKDFQEEINNQAIDLGILIEETGKSINQAKSLLEKTESAIETAVEWIRESIRLFENVYPKAPYDIDSQVFVDFLKENPNFLKLQPDFIKDVRELETMIAELEDLEITPSEKLVTELSDKMKSLQAELADLEKQYKAKEAIVQKFADIAQEYKRAEAAKKQAEEDAKFLQGIFGTKVNQPSTDVEVKVEKETAKKRITAIASTVDESLPTNSTIAANVKRHNSFLNNVNRMTREKASSLRMSLVNSKNAPEGIMEKALAGYATADTDNTVVAIYSNENGEYVDVNGNPTTNPEEYVISVMASDKLTNAKGDRYAVPDDVNVEDWENWYKGMRTKWLSADEPEVYEFTTSGGIPVKNEANTPHNVTENLVSQEQLSNKGLIQVSIDGTINVNGISKKYTPGAVVLVNGNSTAFLNNRNFTDEEAELIYQAFQNLATTKKGEKWNPAIVKYLRDVMLFGDPTTGDKPKSAARNQFWIDNKGQLNIGPNGFKASFTPEFLALPEIKEGLKKIIKGAYQNVNANTLKSNDKFTEIIGFTKEGTPKTRVWESYQHYLLSPIYQLDTALDDNEENGKKRSNVPLTNNLQLPIDGTEPFIQKYSTIVPREDEVVVATPKKETRTKNVGLTKQQEAPKPKGKRSLTANFAAAGLIPSTEETPLEEDTFTSNEPVPTSEYNIEDFIKASEDGADAFVMQIPGTTGTSQADMALRLTTGESANRMTPEDHDYFLEWMSKNLPNVPVTKINRLIDILGTDRQAWGRFTAAGIEVYEHAEEGTEFHEAFEAVWNTMLDEAEQVNLYEEFINSKGSFFDRETLQTIERKDATISQAKEAIADEFGVFSRENRINAIPKSKNLIVKFFRALKELLKYWIGSKKYRLFTDIHNAKFATKQPVRKFNGNAFRQTIPGTDAFTTREIVEDLSANVAFVLLGDKDNEGFYSSFKDISAEQLFNEVKTRVLGNTTTPGRIRELVAALNTRLKSLDGRQKAEQLEVAKQINHAIKIYKTIEVNWDESVKIAKEFLRSAFKIKITDEISMDEKENKGKNEYTKNDFLIDSKQNSTSAMKLLFATLVQTDKSGELIEGTVMPKVAENSYGGPKLVHSGKSFIDVMKNLTDVNTLKEQLQKLYLLGKNNPDYVRLYTRLKGNMDEQGSLQYDKMDFNDWKLIFDFYTTFAKQAPTPFIIFNNKGNENEEGETYMAPADLNSLAKLQIQQWIGNLRTIAKAGNEYVKKTKVGRLNAFSVDTSSFKVSTGTDDKSILKNNLLPKLSLLGIVIDKKVIKKLTPAEATKLRSAAQNLIKEINIKNAISINAKNSSVQGRMNEIANIVVRNTDLEQKSTFFNIDNEQQQIFINDNFYSKFANTLNNIDTLDNLIAQNPQFNDVLLKNSLMFKKGGIYFDNEGKRTDTKLTVAYMNGVQMDNDRSKAIDKLNLGERLLTSINALVNGFSNIVMPGDSATEWMMSMKNNIQMEDLSSDVYKKKLKSIFGGYLMDEMNLIVDTPNRVFNLFRKENKLRLFEGILPEDFKKQIYKFTDTKPTVEEVEEFVKKNKDKVGEAIDKFVTIEAESVKQALINEGKVVTHYLEGAGTVYSINGLDSAFESVHFGKTKIETDRAYAVLNEEGLDNFFKFVAVNYAINNTEIVKTLFGDVGTFKSIQDSLKRIKSFGSPRKSIASGEAVDNALNQVFNKSGDVKLTSSDYGYTNFDNEVSTYTLSDFEVVGSPAIYDGNEDYDNVDRSDGQMWAMPTFYREALLKSGMWDAEDFFQYDSAKFRQYYAKRNKAYGKAYAKNLALVAQDLKTIEKGRPSEMVVPLKPIITGAKSGIEYIDTVLDKQSAFPLFFSFTEEGSHLREHFVQNFENSQDFSIVLSGRKKGAQELHNFYNTNGTVNKTKISDASKFTIPLTAFGIQQETSAHEDNSQTRGTQATKLAHVNLYDNGVPVDYKGKKDWFELTEDERLDGVNSPIYVLLRHNENMLKELTNIGYDNLLKELGIVDNNGTFTVTDYQKLSDRLYDEIVSRESNQNVYDSVKLNEVGKLAIAPEASNNYQVIKNILLSIVDKTVVSPKMHGGAKIQVSSSMWDNDSTLKPYIKRGKKWEEVKDFDSLSPADKEKVRLFSTRLKFYTKNADGTTNPSEVLLPNWFKRKLEQSPKLKGKTDQEILDYLNNTEEGKRILTGVGFRIPTQEINSIEVFKVAGFLHPSLGDSIVVPAEITTKSGGDFDVDKLNTYLKNVYIDAKGDLKLVQYKGTKQESDIFYTNEFMDISDAEALNLNKKIIKKGNLQATLSAIILGEMSEKGEQKWNRILKNMFGDDATATDIEEELMRKLTDYGKQLKDLEDINLQEALLQVFVDKMYKQSIQNEYTESFEKIMLLPQNYDRLLIPNSDFGMKDMRDELNRLFGRDKISTSSPLLSLSYINNQRQLSIAGKDNVGIGAIAQVNHSLTQRQPVYIDPTRIMKTYPKDIPFLGDGTIKLRDSKGNPLYNEVVVKGKPYVSLSGRTDKAGKLITDKISAYLNGFVDILKDTFIAELGVNRANAGIFLFLERIGIPSETVIYFMNQPIIVEYNKLLTQLSKPFLFNTENVQYVLKQFEGGDDVDTINTENLAKNIETYFKDGKKGWTNVDNAQQRLVLSEFLKYAKMANQLREHIQAVTWDTANFSDFTLLEIKKMLLENVKKYSIFNTPEDILNNSFLGKLKDKIGKASEAIGSFLKLQVGEGQRAILKTLYPLIDPKDNYMSAKDAIKLGNKVTASFVDYLMQTKSNIYGSPLGSYIARQLTDETKGTAFKLKQIKDDPSNTLNQNYAISSLSYMIGEQDNQVSNLRLKLPTKDVFSQNAFIQGLRELKAIDPELYRGIVFTSVLQSGTYKSYLSFTDLLPLEDFSAMINPILDRVANDSSLEWYNEAKLFLKNNWKDKEFVPKAPTILKSKAGKWYSPWLINPYYNSNTVKNFEKITNNSLEHPIFVPMWRQEAGSSIITISRDNTVDYTEAQIKQNKNRGDYRHKIIVGYQQVMDGDQPFIIPDKNNSAFDKMVYKPINLYGDGVKAQEYYDDNRPSQLNNGSYHIQQELTDQQVIDSFYGNVQPTVTKQIAPVVKTVPVEFKRNTLKTTEAEEIYNKLGNKTVSENVKIVDKPYLYTDQQKRGEAVVAYKSTKMPASFENPFHVRTDKSTKENVVSFIDFVLNSNEPQAEWIRGKMKSGEFKGKPIYYGNTQANKENTPSHATALDYLINKYNWKVEAPTKPVESKTSSNTKIIEGDIWTSGGIPIITTNLGGIHGAGLANQAFKKGYIKYKQEGDFGDRGKVITFPVKKIWSDKTNLPLLTDSANKLIKLANANPVKQYSLPLVGLGHGEGNLSEILPVIKNILASTNNVKLILPTETTDRGKQGTVRTDNSLSIVEQVKKELSTSKAIVPQEMKEVPVKTGAANKTNLLERLGIKKGPCE